MYRLLATTAVALAMAAPLPAMAWDANTTGKQSPIAQDGGVVNQPIAQQRQKAVSRSASTASSTSSATTGAAANATNYGAGSGNGNYSEGAALSLPSPAASGANHWSCPVVGAGLGATGKDNGGILSYATTSEWCQTMLLAEVAGEPLNPTQVAILSDEFPQFRRAWEAGHPPMPVAPVAAVAPPPLPPASEALHGTAGGASYCAGWSTWTASERRRHQECKP